MSQKTALKLLDAIPRLLSLLGILGLAGFAGFIDHRLFALSSISFLSYIAYFRFFRAFIDPQVSIPRRQAPILFISFVSVFILIWALWFGDELSESFGFLGFLGYSGFSLGERSSSNTALQ